MLEIGRVVELCLAGLEVKSVLDVGTGSGVFAEGFVKKGISVTGVDVNQGFLETARRLVPGVDFQMGLAERLPFAAGSFDLVFLGHVLHETNDPALALGEARRVGRYRVSVLEWPYRREEHGPPLEHRLKPETIVALANAAGFRDVEWIQLTHMELFRLTL